jgi:hypothetical protein
LQWHQGSVPKKGGKHHHDWEDDSYQQVDWGFDKGRKKRHLLSRDVKVCF